MHCMVHGERNVIKKTSARQTFFLRKNLCGHVLLYRQFLNAFYMHNEEVTKGTWWMPWLK